MVNKAVQEMVTAAHGEATWQSIRRRAGVTDAVFVSNQGYPDDVTYRLVAAASETLSVPAERILHAFGEHWVLNTARKSYGHLLAAGGSTVGEFIAHLPHLHDRIALIYPNLVPPRFEVTDRTERTLRLHYLTDRPGLTPFVEGLLHGLGRLYETAVAVTLLESRSAGADHDVFLVAW